MSDNNKILTSELSGEVFLQEFQEAVKLSDTVGSFESWILDGSARNDMVATARNNLIYTDAVLTVGGLVRLLDSPVERERMEGLIEETRKLNITRYLGHEVTITQHERRGGGIRKYIKNKPNVTDWSYPPGPPTWFSSATSRLTSLSRTKGSFRIGEDRVVSAPWRRTVFWEIFPFDKETGEPIVDVTFTGNS